MSNLQLPGKLPKRQNFMSLPRVTSSSGTITKSQKNRSCDLLEPIKHDDEVTIHRLISIHHTRSFTIGADQNNNNNNNNNKEEEKIYNFERDEIINSLQKFSDDDDNSYYLNNNNNNNINDNELNDIDDDAIDESKIGEITFTIPSQTQYISDNRRGSESLSEFQGDIDAIQQILNEHKSNGNEEEEEEEEEFEEEEFEESINNINKRRNNHLLNIERLHNKPRHKIQREKTPIPSHKKKKDKKDKKKRKKGNGLKIECNDLKYIDNDNDINNIASSYKSISGHLEKKSASKFVGWQKRWFYLWCDTLDYYKESSLQIRGSINLNDIEYVGITNEYSVNIKINSNGSPTIHKNKYHKHNKFTFQIVMKKRNNIPNGGRTYYIRAPNNKIRNEWINIINNNITLLHNDIHHNHQRTSYRDRNSSQYKRNKGRSRSIGCIGGRNKNKNNNNNNMYKKKKQKKNKSSLFSLNNNSIQNRKRHKSVPYNNMSDDDECNDNNNNIGISEREDISYKDICKYSNTGDILLFHTKSSSGAVVRAATGGDYDHIGMIFRLKGGKVGVLEALGAGVQVFLWSNFRKYQWNKQYPRIAFRSLIIYDESLRKDITRKLAQFVKTVVNRHYGWNPVKLIRKQSSLSIYDESRTFFCSELIAKAFKEVGLLRSDFASSQYFPSHFQESKGLKLLKGCSFSSEMEVIWNDNNNQNHNHNDKMQHKLTKSHKLSQSDNDEIKIKKKGNKHNLIKRSKTTGTSSNVQIVSLNKGNYTDDKKQRFRSPPPRQLF